MFLLGIISEALVYICFSILIGSFFLSLVPEAYRPTIHVKKGILMMAASGIAIFSFIPVLQLILFVYRGMGLLQAFQSVLFTFEVGKAWILTFLLSSLLFIFIVWFDHTVKRLYSWIGLIFSFMLILAFAWSSHASTLDPIVGFLTDAAHFGAVSIWVGIVFIVSWFSKDHRNWQPFLKWFTPVAIACFLITVATGLVLMTLIIDLKEYSDAWMIPYGQSLLIKHLLIIPLLGYAFINSILVRKRLKKDLTFDPRPWTKVESIILLLIFSATSALGQQSPPHDIVTIVMSEGFAKFFTFFYDVPITVDLSVQLSLNASSISFFVLAMLFLALVIFSFMKKAPVILSFTMSVLLVLSTYFALMLSVTVLY